MASRSLGTLTVDLIAKVGGFTRGMTQAERQADKSARAVEQRMKRMAKGIDAALQAAAAVAVAAAAGIAVGVGNALNRMDEIVKSAQKVGISSESFSKLAYAAELSGVEVGQLEGALAKLAKSQDMAAQGSKEQLDIFRALGVEFRNADGTLRATDEVFADIADRFQALPDGANKTAAAMALLGRSGAQLIPLLNGGSGGLQDMGDELQRFGGVVGPEAAKQAEQFNDDLTRLKTAATGLWQSLAIQLLPDLVNLTERMVEAAKEGGDVRDAISGAATVVRGFGLAAQLAVDSVQAMTFQAIGLYNVLEGISRLGPGGMLSFFDGRSAGDAFRDAGVAFEMAGSAGDETRANFFGATGPAPAFDWAASEEGAQRLAEQAKLANNAEENERKLAAALEEQRKAQERAAAARKAAAEAAREQAKADREAEAQARAFEVTQSSLAKVLRQQAEDMGGPLAQAAFAYTDTMVELQAVQDELVRLGKLDEEQTNRIALAREQANASYQKSIEAIQNQADPLSELLASMDIELGLMRMGNAERVTELELQRLIYEYRQKGIDLTADEIEAARARIQAKAEEIEALGQQISALDEFRQSFEDNVAGVLDGSKSIKDAIRDLVDDFIAQLARMAAKSFTSSMFGQQGTSGGGWFGDLLGSFLGGFGGPRASGGPVVPGKAYLVGEEGPELIRPMGAGTVVPARETASMLGARSRGGDTFIFQGATSNRSVDRVRMERTRADRRAEVEYG